MIGLKFECQVAVCINVHLHGFDVFGEELISFRGCHFHASDFQCFVEHVILTQNFKAKFVMTITYDDGTTATFEVETGLKNLKDVATALKADAEYETLSLAQQAIVDGFAGV